MNVRALRDRLMPSLTRQRLLSVVNPGLRMILPVDLIRARLARVLRRSGIEYLDLGGWAPVEQYLTVHLSLVEPYGIPLEHSKTLSVRIDENAGVPHLVERALEGTAVSLCFDATRGLPLDDASLQGVNLSHFLEHFDLATGRSILRECRRILRAGGIIRVSCPDLRKYAQAYVEGDAEFFSVVAAPAYCNYRSLPTNAAIVAGKAYDGDNGHKWFYDAETVIQVLAGVGFVAAKERGVHQSALPHVEEIEPAYRSVESFYVEAVA